MNPRGPGQLRQAHDGILHFSRRHHHQIRQLVDNDDDLRHPRQFLPVHFSGSHQFVHLFIVAFYIPDAGLRKLLIAVRHLRHCPVQRPGRFFRVRHDRNEQMRNPVICTELHHLRVDHDQLHLRWLRLIKNTHDQRVDADGLTGTGRSGDEQMRHLCQVCYHNLPADIFTDRKCQL